MTPRLLRVTTMKSRISTLLAMLAAVSLGVMAGGCTEVVGSDIDGVEDVDAELELEQSAGGVDAVSDQSLIQGASRTHDDDEGDGADNEDPYGPAAEKKSQGLDFNDVVNLDPEPAPWSPLKPTDT